MIVDVPIVNKRFVAAIVAIVLSLWMFPVGLCIVAGSLVAYRLLARRNDGASAPSKGATLPRDGGFDPAATISAILAGDPVPGASDPPRPPRKATRTSARRGRAFD